MTDTRALPLGSSAFDALRDADEIYVDKTAMIYELASARRKIFLARPRRFGKSLLVSTFESLFKHGLRDFQGLAIEKLWKEEKTFLTVRLDFSEIKLFDSAEAFSSSLKRLLIRNFMEAGFNYNPDSILSFTDQFSQWLKSLDKNSLVLLIDEYDAPLTKCMNNHDLFDAARNELSAFYASLKSNDSALRFLFLTGIMKFGKASIFSELNNLTDISLSPRFGTLLGYTHQEVKDYFSHYLKQASDILGLSQDELFFELVRQYDGYCFENTAKVHVFAPWSLLSFLSDPESGFQNYWVDSAGNPTVLQQYLKDHSLREPEDYFKPKNVALSQLKARAADLEKINDVTLLTFAGYLTIKAIGSTGFLVGYPNKEVSDALAWLYRDRLLRGKSPDELGAFNLKNDICAGNVDQLILQLNKLYLTMDYRKYPITNEITCRNYAQLFLTLGAGIQTYSEIHNALGRSDLEVETDSYHLVFEAKFLPAEMHSEKSAQKLVDDAMRQMQEKHYGETNLKGKKLIRIGFVFSEKERQITKYAYF